MTVSKQVLAQWLAHMVALVVGYLLARQGIDLSATASAEVAGAASLVAGPLAGVFVKAEPAAAVVTDELGKLLAVVAESTSNGRSALSASGRPSTAAAVESPPVNVP